jgi:hypothetical protein
MVVVVVVIAVMVMVMTVVVPVPMLVAAAGTPVPVIVAVVFLAVIGAVRTRADLVVEGEDLLDSIRLQIVTVLLACLPLAVLEGLLAG